MTFAACTKKDPTVEVRANQVSTTINGSLWQSGINNIATTGNLRQVFALKADSTSVRLYFPADTIGSFDLATNSNVTVAYYEEDVFWNTEVSGTLNITQNSAETLEGTFFGKLVSVFGSDTVSLENGVFYWRSL